MRVSDEEVWVVHQFSKVSFAPVRVRVLDTRAEFIHVSTLGNGKVLRRIVEESDVFDSEKECGTRCIELMELRRSAFVDQHEARIRDLDKNLKDMRDAQSQ